MHDARVQVWRETGHVVLEGGSVPFRFVPWDAFQAAMQDGVVTMSELEALDPLPGVASRYHETLKPREGDHLIVINARGTLDDGRSFHFNVTHIEDQAKSIRVEFR